MFTESHAAGLDNCSTAASMGASDLPAPPGGKAVGGFVVKDVSKFEALDTDLGTMIGLDSRQIIPALIYPVTTTLHCISLAPMLCLGRHRPSVGRGFMWACRMPCVLGSTNVVRCVFKAAWKMPTCSTQVNRRQLLY